MCYIASSLIRILCSSSVSFSWTFVANETWRDVDAYRRFDECYCVYRTLLCIFSFFASLSFLGTARWNLSVLLWSSFRAEVGIRWLNQIDDFWKNFGLIISTVIWFVLLIQLFENVLLINNFSYFAIFLLRSYFAILFLSFSIQPCFSVSKLSKVSKGCGRYNWFHVSILFYFSGTLKFFVYWTKNEIEIKFQKLYIQSETKCHDTLYVFKSQLKSELKLKITKLW